MQLAIPLDGDFQMGRQRVDHRNADTVQAAGKVVVALGELATGVQAGEDQLDARQAFFFMKIHRHPAAIVLDTQRAITVQHHVDAFGMAGQCFIHTVVDHFLSQVIGPAGVCVHSRALAHRVQATQYFNSIGVILLLAHGQERTPRLV